MSFWLLAFTSSNSGKDTHYESAYSKTACVRYQNVALTMSVMNNVLDFPTHNASPPEYRPAASRIAFLAQQSQHHDGLINIVHSSTYVRAAGLLFQPSS